MRNSSSSAVIAVMRGYIRAAIDALPLNQREVLLLRDVQGCSAQDVCNLLQLSESNQRVLLHRGRSKVRRTLDQFLGLFQNRQHTD